MEITNLYSSYSRHVRFKGSIKDSSSSAIMFLPSTPHSPIFILCSLHPFYVLPCSPCVFLIRPMFSFVHLCILSCLSWHYSSLLLRYFLLIPMFLCLPTCSPHPLHVVLHLPCIPPIRLMFLLSFPCSLSSAFIFALSSPYVPSYRLSCLPPLASIFLLVGPAFSHVGFHNLSC
jgi:hypothetical protein